MFHVQVLFAVRSEQAQPRKNRTGGGLAPSQPGYHFNGSTWRLLTAGATSELGSVTVFAEDSVSIDGNGGLLWHFDGASWLPVRSDTNNRLTDGWTHPDEDLVVVVQDGTLLHLYLPGGL